MAVALQLERHVIVAVVLQLYGVKPHFPSYFVLKTHLPSGIIQSELTELQQLKSMQGESVLHCAGVSLFSKEVYLDISVRRLGLPSLLSAAIDSFSALVALGPICPWI
jgi:hypothetical protein